MVSCEHLGGFDSGVLTDGAKLLRVSQTVKSPHKAILTNRAVNKIFFSASAPGECIESVGWVRSLYAHMVSCEHLGGCDSGVLTDCAKLLRVSRPVKSPPVKPY